jgi:hypothetical protein
MSPMTPQSLAARQAFSVKRTFERLLLALIAAYQRWISPGLPRRCRYEPTCSAYAAEAIRELGPLRGAAVAGWRLLRCNPFSRGGIDDLCDRTLFASHPHSHADPRPSEPARQSGAGLDPAGASR